MFNQFVLWGGDCVFVIIRAEGLRSNYVILRVNAFLMTSDWGSGTGSSLCSGGEDKNWETVSWWGG